MTLNIGFEEERAGVGLDAVVGKGRRSPCELRCVSWSES